MTLLEAYRLGGYTGFYDNAILSSSELEILPIYNFFSWKKVGELYWGACKYELLDSPKLKRLTLKA